MVETVDTPHSRHWGRRAFVAAWVSAITALGAGAAWRWRSLLDELTRTPSGRGADTAVSSREAQP